MSRYAYLDCVGGVAGDMLLAALLDAGADLDVLRALPGRLGLGDVDVRVETVERHGVRAQRVEVIAPEQPPVRHWPEIRELLAGADLEDDVRERSLLVFQRLAETEARVHGVAVEEVHFHEIGAVDTLIDICGVVLLLDGLGVERLVCSPLPVGRGLTRTAHGMMPLPVPATAELLRGLPVVGVEVEQELVTPTGAALVSTLASEFGHMPALVLTGIGNGAGARDLPERPNLVRVCLGEGQGTSGSTEIVCVETNLDDLLPELIPDAVERCFAAGALDVWTTPVQMKKGRPGFVLTALARPAAEAAIARAMLEETSALGVRVSRRHRYELERETRRVVLPGGGSVGVKLGWLDGRLVNVAPEHDDCAALARRTGRPVKVVWAAAMAAVGEQPGRVASGRSREELSRPASPPPSLAPQSPTPDVPRGQPVPSPSRASVFGPLVAIAKARTLALIEEGAISRDDGEFILRALIDLESDGIGFTQVAHGVDAAFYKEISDYLASRVGRVAIEAPMLAPASAETVAALADGEGQRVAELLDLLSAVSRAPKLEHAILELFSAQEQRRLAHE